MWSYRIVDPYGSCDGNLCRACSAKMRAGAFCTCAQLPPGQGSPIPAILGTALRLLRAGELLRLTQADLDVDAGALHIRHSKFNKSRVVPLTPDLVQRLVQCRTAAEERYGPGPRTRRYSPARAEVGIPLPRFTQRSTTL